MPDERDLAPLPDDDASEAETMPSEELLASDNPSSNEEYSEPRAYSSEDDVPFRLPLASDAASSSSDDETADLPPIDDPAPGGKKYQPYEMPTMPVYQEPPRSSAANTLMGSGGLDPNPDFYPRPEATMRSPKVQPPTPPPRVNQPTYRPNQGYSPYQRPPQVLPTPQQSALPPLPPGASAPPQAAPPGKSKRRAKNGVRRKTFLGLPIGCLYIFLGTFLTFCGGFTCLTVTISAWAYNRVDTLARERLTALDNYTNFQSTFFYDRNGTLLYEAFNEGRRSNVSYSDFPQYLIEATIAIEDDTFWTNPGIEVEANIRAGLQYLGIVSGSSGASTITQQLVRNVLFDFQYRAERSLTRKLEEIILALALTQQRSKEDILTLYLNEIYYGNLAYGAEAAAQIFFGKSVNELTLGEAALLAGLPQAPADLDPLDPDPNVQAAVDIRWRTVLDRMVTEGFISDAERDAALEAGLVYNTTSDVSLRAPHFTVYAQDDLVDVLGQIGLSPEQIAAGGFHVYTTLDLDINEMAQQAAAAQVARLAGNNVTNGAVIILQPTTGEILGMVGSVDYYNDAIDGRVNVTTAVRQPGSTMKVFTYAAALEASVITPGSVIWDTPTLMRPEYPEGTPPRNYDGGYHGPMSMRAALANSYNIPALQTMRLIGVDYLLNFANRLGMTSLGTDASRYGISLTLGGGEVSLLELARGYAVFANQGVYVETTSILCVVDNNENIIYQYENGCPRGNLTSNSVNRTGLGAQVLDPRIAFLMSDILRDNVARSAAMGSNSVLNTGNVITSVKTGTTNDYKDNWTVGFTPNVVVGVWVGNNNGDPMNNVSGLTGAAPIWNTVITSIYNNPEWLARFAVNGGLNPEIWPNPPGMTYTRICDVRRLVDPAVECPTMNEWMLDYPAGVPDGQGGLMYPNSSFPSPVLPGNTYMVEESPSVYRVLVQAIPPQISAMITIPAPAGQAAPPSPIYCQIPVDLAATAPASQSLLFIAPPPNADDAARAEEWARGRGLAFLPTIACTPELLTMQMPVYAPSVPEGTVAVINSPTPNQVVSGGMPIMGTAQFNPNDVLYYKIEIIGGQWSNWTTLGETHNQNVINGQLEWLAPLPPGSYRIRLVLISAATADILMQPYEVPIIAQ
ncbi:MAG: transglycosylase domain-containing protein [Chloroflexi bacterium]|nr:transglycosylase domain-containing protein [Chloroflexota bacterium]